jgi:hypothetical protein
MFHGGIRFVPLPEIPDMDWDEVTSKFHRVDPPPAIWVRGISKFNAAVRIFGAGAIWMGRRR